MAIFQALFAALIHSLGRILTTVFGWATALLFGRVSPMQQVLMSVATLGSVIWLAALIGIVFPAAGMFLLAAFVPRNISQHQGLVRLGMTAIVLLFPLANGAVFAFGKHQKTPAQVVHQMLLGWRYTVGLAITLMLMVVFAPILKLRLIFKRWCSQHMTVFIPSAEYESAVSDIESVLEAAGTHVVRRRASWMLTVPTKILTAFAGKHVAGVAADNLAVLAGHDFEIMVHPSDLIISGKSREVSGLSALMVERLPFSHVLMTWTTPANDVERQLKKLWREAVDAAAPPWQIWNELQEEQKRMSDLQISYEEWAVLYRETLQIEGRLLRPLVKHLRRAS